MHGDSTSTLYYMELQLIMIVDDDKDDRFFFEEALKKINPEMTCIHAMHGEDALEKLKPLTVLPQFIFLDLNMPVMNGVGFLEQLNAHPAFRQIPVIVYTTSVSEYDMKITRELGAKYYLPKTAEIEKLPAKITFAIDMIRRATD
ncbi:MAG: response regulator, partial [Bacteroidota bacterium]